MALSCHLSVDFLCQEMRDAFEELRISGFSSECQSSLVELSPQ